MRRLVHRRITCILARRRITWTATDVRYDRPDRIERHLVVQREAVSVVCSASSLGLRTRQWTTVLPDLLWRRRSLCLVRIRAYLGLTLQLGNATAPSRVPSLVGCLVAAFRATRPRISWMALPPSHQCKRDDDHSISSTGTKDRTGGRQALLWAGGVLLLLDRDLHILLSCLGQASTAVDGVLMPGLRTMRPLVLAIVHCLLVAGTCL